MQRMKAFQMAPTPPLFPVVKVTPFRALAKSPEEIAMLKCIEDQKFSLRHDFQCGGLIGTG